MELPAKHSHGFCLLSRLRFGLSHKVCIPWLIFHPDISRLDRLAMLCGWFFHFRCFWSLHASQVLLAMMR